MTSPRVAAIFRALLNSNGELGSALALLAMSAVGPVMLDSALFGGLADRAFPAMSPLMVSINVFVAGTMLACGFLQFSMLLADRRGGRMILAYSASFVWASSIVTFWPIKFYGCVVLGVVMVTVNVLVAARARLQVVEWERMGCGRADCERREPLP